MRKRLCCSKEGLNRGAWTAEEDEILMAYIRSHGEGKWRSLPKKAGLKRCGKSCRLRWLNYLRPDIKRGNISEQEEDLIIRLHNLLGNKWSLIAGRLPGRTDNEIKNYWNTTLSRKVHGRPLRRPKPSRTAEDRRRKPAGEKLPAKASPQLQMLPQEPANDVKLDTPFNGDEQAPCLAAVKPSANSDGTPLRPDKASDNLMAGLDLIEEMFTGTWHPDSSLFLVTGEGARHSTSSVAAGDEGSRGYWPTRRNADDMLLGSAVVADGFESTDSSQCQHSPSDFQFVASFLNLEEWL